jgi:uncharacterized protein
MRTLAYDIVIMVNCAMSLNFTGAKTYALQRLQELPSTLTYHAVTHTRDDVVPAAEGLGILEYFTRDDRMLLSTAAWFHDLGYLERYNDNEVIAVRIAQEVLPKLKYSPKQVEVVCNIIMATRLPQSPHTPLEMVMADADLSSLGGKNFLQCEHALRQEFARMGRAYTDEAWYTYQQQFLREHNYFTAAAHELYDAQKAVNLAIVENLLAQINQ